MAAIWSRDHEARDRSDSRVVISNEAEALHQPGEMRRLTVVAPPHRLAIDEGEQRSHLATLDERGHVAAVVAGGSSRPFGIVFRPVRLHAVAALPGGIISERDVV